MSSSSASLGCSKLDELLEVSWEIEEIFNISLFMAKP
jgi:hypothetical protein